MNNIRLVSFLLSYKAKLALEKAYDDFTDKPTSPNESFFNTVFEWRWGNKPRLKKQTKTETHFETIAKTWFDEMFEFERVIIVSQQDLIDDQSLLSKFPPDAQLCILSIDNDDQHELVDALIKLSCPDDSVVWYWKEFARHNLNYEKIQAYDEKFWENYGESLKRWFENNIQNTHPFYQHLYVLQNTLNIPKINIEDSFDSFETNVKDNDKIVMSHLLLPFVNFFYTNKTLSIRSGLSKDDYLEQSQTLLKKLEDLLPKEDMTTATPKKIVHPEQWLNVALGIVKDFFSPPPSYSATRSATQIPQIVNTKPSTPIISFDLKNKPQINIRAALTDVDFAIDKNTLLSVKVDGGKVNSSLSIIELQNFFECNFNTEQNLEDYLFKIELNKDKNEIVIAFTKPD